MTALGGTQAFGIKNEPYKLQFDANREFILRA